MTLDLPHKAQEPTVAQRLENSVYVLDKISPDWRSKVNVDTLDMGDSFNCILGQIFGNYGEAMYDNNHQGLGGLTISQFAGLNRVYFNSSASADKWKKYLSQPAATSEVKALEAAVAALRAKGYVVTAMYTPPAVEVVL